MVLIQICINQLLQISEFRILIHLKLHHLVSKYFDCQIYEVTGDSLSQSYFSFSHHTFKGGSESLFYFFSLTSNSYSSKGFNDMINIKLTSYTFVCESNQWTMIGSMNLNIRHSSVGNYHFPCCPFSCRVLFR